MSQSIGVIGLGAMGRATSQSLRCAGVRPPVRDVCSTVNPNWSLALDAMAAKVDKLGDRAGNGSKVRVITHSAGNSWMFEARMAHVLAGDCTPLSATAHQTFMQASTAGQGREDDSAVIKIFPGIQVPAKG